MANKLLLLTQTVQQGTGNIVSDMGGEKVMLSIQNGKYYNLGELGGEIWEKIKEETTIEVLVNSLLEEYEVEKDVCEKQVISFLETLSEEGLIVLKNASAS